MTEPSSLEYCVRDRDGRIVVPWRPVDELVAASKDYGRHEHRRGYALGENLLNDADRALRDSIAARKRLGALLGIEPEDDGEG